MAEETLLVGETLRKQELAAAANFTLTIPDGWAIRGIYMHNTTGNAVTGGIRIGTTDGGADVVVAQAVSANAIVAVTDAAILLNWFAASQQLFIQAVAAWNSAVVDVFITCERVPS